MNPTTNTLAHDSAISFFVCGLVWLAGSALVIRGGIPQDLRSPRGWLFVAAAAQWLENWLQIAVVRTSGLAVFAGLCLALGALSAVALVEYAARRFKSVPLWMPRRWVYIPLTFWTTFSTCYLQGSGLEISYQILFAWAVIGLAWRAAVVARPGETNVWRILALAALVGYSLAMCGRLTGLGSILALVMLVGFWRGRLVADARARRVGRGNCLPVAAWRRWALPAAFSLALGAGCLSLGSGDVRLAEEVVAPNESTHEQLFAALESESVQPPEEEVERQLKRCGMAAAPIVGLVLAVWGLSRLPFAR